MNTVLTGLILLNQFKCLLQLMLVQSRIEKEHHLLVQPRTFWCPGFNLQNFL